MMILAKDITLGGLSLATNTQKYWHLVIGGTQKSQVLQMASDPKSSAPASEPA